LFVGTKKQAQDSIAEEASRCGMYYVNQRWLGGMLTNFSTVKQSIDRLKKIDAMFEDGTIEAYPKKERLLLEKDREKLQKILGGIKGMSKLPSVMFVIDPKNEEIAIQEANKLGIPVVAVVDTNCDPDPIDHIIACNDDSLKSIKMILQELATAIIEKKKELNISFLKGEEEAMQPEVELAEEVEAEEKGLEPVKSEGEPL
ncbi:MAG TPA: 30S ribosomal protein S2, partial [Parachlamydiales bacterium]|nr:30S ribosomal protein S2 [Parachlamydiales bacterium]